MPKPTRGLFYLTLAVEPQNYGLVKAGLLDTRQVKIMEDVYVEYDQTIVATKNNQTAQQVLAALPSPTKKKMSPPPKGRPNPRPEFAGLNQRDSILIVLKRLSEQGKTQVSIGEIFEFMAHSTKASVTTCLNKMVKDGFIGRASVGMYQTKKKGVA